MQPWVDSHIDWVRKLTKHFLDVRKRKFDDFIIEWLHSSFPLNEAGILIMARAYKIHVAVFFNDSYWSTCADKDLNKCKVFLLYRGSLVFEDTRHMTTKEYEAHRPILRKLQQYYDTVEQEKVLDSLKHQADRERQLARHREASTLRNYIPSDEDSETEEQQNIMPPGETDKTENIMLQSLAGTQNVMAPAAAKDDDVDLEEMMNDEEPPDNQDSSMNDEEAPANNDSE